MRRLPPLPSAVRTTLQHQPCKRGKTHSLKRSAENSFAGPRHRQHTILRLRSYCTYGSVNTRSTVLRGMLTENNLQHQQRCSHYDRAVREVEHRPLILLHVEEHKIHDAPAGHAIP